MSEVSEFVILIRLGNGLFEQLLMKNASARTLQNTQIVSMAYRCPIFLFTLPLRLTTSIRTMILIFNGTQQYCSRKGSTILGHDLKLVMNSFHTAQKRLILSAEPFPLGSLKFVSLQ